MSLIEKISAALKKRRVSFSFDGVLHTATEQMLMMLAVAIFAGSAYALATHAMTLENVMNAIGDVMIAIVVVEVVRTVHMRFESSIRYIQRLLMIAIAAAVREVLFSSAELSFDHQPNAVAAHMAPLIAGTAMVVCFGVLLVLLRRLDSPAKRVAQNRVSA